MTLKKFIKKYKNDCRYYFDGYYSDCIDDFLTNIYNDHEARLKAKDEEIINLYNKFGEANEKSVRDGYALGIKKARSIVAMLFWRAKKDKRMYELTKLESYLAITPLNNATLSSLIFQQAYKMLK